MSRPDLPALAAGLAVAALGAVLLLDGLGTWDLRFSAAAPAVLAAIGVVLVAAGAARQRERG